MTILSLTYYFTCLSQRFILFTSLKQAKIPSFLHTLLCSVPCFNTILFLTLFLPFLTIYIFISWTAGKRKKNNNALKKLLS